jgi:hypothetical protein
MTKQPITMRPPANRLLAWGNERFGPAPILLYFLLYLAGILYARAITGDPNPSVSPLDVVAFSAVFGYFLLVRVLDEHKDYDKDCINFPDRILQRGLVTLDQLKVIGVLTLVPQIVVSALVDGGVGPVTLAWLVLFGWTMLMLKEFFARQWLEPKLVLYAILHLLAGPLALLWIALIGADGKQLPTSVGWLALMAFLGGATLEVGRKLHAPEDERDTVASYTKSFGGPAGATAVLTALIVGTVANCAVLLAVVRADTDVTTTVFVVVTVTAVGMTADFGLRPSARSTKLAEFASVLTVLVSLLVVITGLLTGVRP